jgi:hypothetical protein
MLALLNAIAQIQFVDIVFQLIDVRRLCLQKRKDKYQQNPSQMHLIKMCKCSRVQMFP